MSTNYCFSVPYVECPSCEKTILNTLSATPTVWQRVYAFFTQKTIHRSFYKTITLNNKTITLQHVRTSGKQLNVTIQEEGLLAEDVMALLNVELEAVSYPCGEVLSEGPSQPPKNSFRWLYGFLGVGAGLALLVLPFITGPLSIIVMASIGGASTIMTLALGAESYKKAWTLLFNRGLLHMDTLFAVSTLTALVASLTALFVPGLPMMFEAGLLIFGFRHMGEAIRESLEQSMELNEKFQDRAPRRVKRVLATGELEEVDTALIQQGDLLFIENGVIPVDGVCEEGTHGQLNVALVSGADKEDLVSLQSNMPIFSGSILTNGQLYLRASLPANQSLLARKDIAIAASLNSKSAADDASWKTDADQILNYFIPAVFGIAILSGIVVGCFFPLAMAIQSAVAVLVSACPCTLGLVTGMAVRVGMKKAANHHMEFKNAKIFEMADQVQHVVFDLNGTLTTTVPEVIDMDFNSSDHSYEDILKYVLTLEQGSTKAVGMALFNYAAAKTSAPIQSVPINNTKNSGVTADIDGETYTIGEANLMNKTALLAYQQRTLMSDENIIYLARGDVILGHFILRRPLRPEARTVVRALQNMGKIVHLWTGSGEDAALRQARALGIHEDNVRFSMSSSDKLGGIKALQKKYRVAMIGDEENDSEAIAASDFGIAMPTDGVRNMSHLLADAVSSVHSLKPIVPAFEISRQTAENIRQNLIFSWSYNVIVLVLPILLLLTTGVVLGPGVCVGLMIVQTSLILLNTYRFKQQGLEYLSAAENDVKHADESSYSAIKSMLPTHASQQTTSCSDTLASTVDESVIDRIPGLIQHSESELSYSP